MVHIACQHLLRMLRINMAVLDKLVHRGIWRRIKIASEYDRNWSFRIVKSTYDCQQHLTLPQLNLQKKHTYVNSNGTKKHSLHKIMSACECIENLHHCYPRLRGCAYLRRSITALHIHQRKNCCLPHVITKHIKMNDEMLQKYHICQTCENVNMKINHELI